MKKTTIIACAILLSLAACKKDNSTTNLKLSSTALKQKARQLDHSYVDMTLIAPNTYAASWWGVTVTAYGPFSWNSAKYPSLVNGVPLIGASMTSDGNSQIAYENTGPDGNVFAVRQGLLGGVSANFQSGLNGYFNDLNIFYSTGVGLLPFIGSYVPNSYSQEGQVITVTGKLIRVTTGSGVAIATPDYPLPGSTPYTVQAVSGIEINDPDQVNHANATYFMSGSSGALTTALAGVNHNYTGGTHLTISGAYMHVSGSIFHCWGTIIRADGSVLSFNVTIDIS